MIAQIFIAIFGVAAVLLTQVQNQNLHKFACIFGLISQPFWFYASWSQSQWGIFALCFVYSLAWAVGFKNHWLKKPVKSQTNAIPEGQNNCECGKLKPKCEKYCWDCEHEPWHQPTVKKELIHEWK